MSDRGSALSGRFVQAGWVVFAVALALRLSVLLQLQDEPLFRSPQLDSLEYRQWAAQIARGDFSWPVAPIHGVGYPLFIGTILGLTKSLAAVRVAQAILGSIGAVLVLSIGGRLYGRLAGLAAGILYATYGPLIFVEVSILAESLFVFLLTLIVWMLIRTANGEVERVHAAVFGAGALLGYAVVVRPTAAALFPLFAWFVARRIVPRRSAVVLFTLATALPILPVLMLNRATAGVAAVQTSAAMNVYIGNSPHHEGTAWARPGGEWDALRGAAWRAGARGSAAEERFYLRLTQSEISARPARFVRLLGTKLLWLVQDDEVRDSHSFHFFAQSSSLLRWLPRFGVVFALALAFALAAWNGASSEHSWLLAGYALILGATVVCLVAGLRYRMPIMPVLFVWAGASLSFAVDAASRRSWGWLTMVALVFCAGLGVSHLRGHHDSHDFSEEFTMTALALKNEGHLSTAVEAARQATLLNPRRDAAWVALGDIEASRGSWSSAEQAWRKALQVRPDNARAWSHLALAHLRRGEKDAGGRLLRRALSIRFDEEAAYNLDVLRKSAP